MYETRLRRVQEDTHLRGNNIFLHVRFEAEAIDVTYVYLFIRLSMATITISYELNPPTQIVKEAKEISVSKTLTHALDCNSSEVGSEAYYGALRVAIAKARDQLGNELTVWRDAVGKAESSKETAKTLKYDVEDAEEEEE